MQPLAASVLALLAFPAHAQAPPAINVPGQGQQAQPMPAPAAPLAPVQADWVAQRTVELRATDKVMARTTTLTAQLGETIRFGPLSVVVRECVIRPPDRPQDAAAFLEISAPGQPSVFRGWMLLSLPQLALVEHPTHDIRLAACKP